MKRVFLALAVALSLIIAVHGLAVADPIEAIEPKAIRSTPGLGRL